MLKSQRQHLILDLIDEKRLITVQELTEHLSASEATIRRDLGELASLGKIKKIHGGAELPEVGRKARAQHLEGSAFLVDKERHTKEKQLIAKKAAEMCEDGGSVIINGGSSTYMMAEYLAEKELNILTNSFPLAMELLETSNNRITLPGGELYRKQKLILSPLEHDTIKHYHATKMFLGSPGIGDFGVMESDPLLISVEQKLMKQVDQLIILADSSKLGKRSNYILCPLEQVDVLITDSGIEEKYLRLFAEHGIQTIIVDPSDQD